MNNNTLGITAVSLVALAGIAAVALQKGRPQLIPSSIPTSLDQTEYPLVLRAADDDRTSSIVANWAKIEKVLNRTGQIEGGKPRGQLYRIRRFDPGSQTQDEGELPKCELLFDYDLAVTELQNEPFKGYAFQIGSGLRNSFQKYPEAAPNMAQGHLKLNILESKEMVEEVNAILHPE